MARLTTARRKTRSLWSCRLRDRNGDPVAAVRVIMKSFAGQTEQAAFARALPVVREMQSHVTSLQDLVQ